MPITPTQLRGLATRLAKRCVERLIDEAEAGTDAALAIGLSDGNVEFSELETLRRQVVNLLHLDAADDNLSRLDAVAGPGERIGPFELREPIGEGCGYRKLCRRPQTRMRAGSQAAAWRPPEPPSRWSNALDHPVPRPHQQSRR